MKQLNPDFNEKSGYILIGLHMAGRTRQITKATAKNKRNETTQERIKAQRGNVEATGVGIPI